MVEEAERTPAAEMVGEGTNYIVKIYLNILAEGARGFDCLFPIEGGAGMSAPVGGSWMRRRIQDLGLKVGPGVGGVSPQEVVGTRVR